jgi:hypothetical protein
MLGERALIVLPRTPASVPESGLTTIMWKTCGRTVQNLWRTCGRKFISPAIARRPDTANEIDPSFASRFA